MLERHTELLRALQTHSVVKWLQVMYYLVNEYLIISSES